MSWTGNGVIDFEEFLDIMVASMEDEESVIKATFDVFDLNGDHFIEGTELKSVIMSCHVALLA